MSQFFITNLSEEQYLEMYKKQRKIFKETGKVEPLDSFYDPDTLGENGAEVFIEPIPLECDLHVLDNEILDDYQDVPYLNKFFDGDYTNEDYLSQNTSLILEYTNLLLFMDEKYLKDLLELVRYNLSLREDDELDGALVRAQHVIKTAIRYKKDFGFNVCCRVLD